ncbi:unnamed protein product [Effrenium voratum]|uniref:Aldehyde dehydrogenase n=1 Tax=Effrenium voratum TaxID=2562239 RepID=A0AA36J844_9DINO|nr:unnamed protein product [Effrenium voratum]|mmetsp:Transcript_114219/g.271886  ORF Transcript_114219/g.271886 Transcript_114219/m.271886 type:complete len:507 (-) Transcript_114219:72-1592(-)
MAMADAKITPEVLKEMRGFVMRGGTSIEFRIEQLELLRNILREEKDAILAALDKDLGLGADEAQALVWQLCPLLLDVNDALDGIRDWSAPKKVATPLALQPASCYVEAQPKGVVLVIGAWNYPLNVTINPFISALAAGNAVIVKPSELAPESALIMQKILGRLDPRAVRVVLGGPEVSRELVASPFDHIAYTGSGRVGKLVFEAAAANMIPVTLELGGKSPVLMCGGINIAEACKRVITGKFVNCGQTCIAPDYLLVERSVKDEVVAQLKAAVQEMLGEGTAAAKRMPRMINAQAANRILTALREAHGGKVEHGGPEVLPSTEVQSADRFVQPTIVVDPSKDSLLMQEEIFGPVLPILTVASCDEAVSYINSKPKPLAVYVFAPQAVVDHVMASTSSGSVVVGDVMVQRGNPSLPFGGIGGSGIGRLQGVSGFEEFSNKRSVMHRPLMVPSALRLPGDAALAKVAWMYANVHPRTLKNVGRGGKLLALLVFVLACRKLGRFLRPSL